MITIHFDGVIEPREVQSVASFKGRLFIARAGQVVYSKIDVRNGAIGVIPESIPVCAVSAEYPVYNVNEDLATPAYIKLLFRTTRFREILNAMVSGASGRKRIQPDEIEKVSVPLPPLEVQQAIVARWQEAQEEAARLESQASDLETQILDDVLERLGLVSGRGQPAPKVFVSRWRQLDRWSVDYTARQLSGALDVHHTYFPLVKLRDVASVSYGIQKSPQNRPGAHARPYLRVANVQNGRLDLSEVKFINVPDAEMPLFRLQAGDLLVCEGNSAALVGRPAIWQDEIADCVHQNHILRVRVNAQLVAPEYVLLYMQTQPARCYFRSRAKFTTNLASINSNDLRDLDLPLPPLDVQNQIVEAASMRRAEVTRLQEGAARLRASVASEVEATILGEKPAPGRR